MLTCRRFMISCFVISFTSSARSITVNEDVFVKLTPDSNRVVVSLNCTGSSNFLSYYIKNRIKWDFVDKNGTIHAVTESFYQASVSDYADKNFKIGHVTFQYAQKNAEDFYNFQIKLHGITQDDVGIYRCTELYENGTIIDSKNVSLTLVNPVETLSLSLYNTGGFMITESNRSQGHTVNIAPGQYKVTCKATGSNPEPTMAVIYNGTQTNVSVKIIEDTSVKGSTSYNGTYSVNLSVEPNASLQSLYCTANIAGDFYKTKEVGIVLMVKNITATEKDFYDCYWVNSTTVDCDLFFPDPRCGTDLVTYKNKCEISRAHCVDKNIHVKHYGACTATDTTSPAPFTESFIDRMCIRLGYMDCPVGGDPVCTSNGRTYKNSCEYQKAKCTHHNLKVVDCMNTLP